MWAGLLELLIPLKCEGCGALGAAFCAACCDRIERILPPTCGQCGVPLPAPEGHPPAHIPVVPVPAVRCSACTLSPPPFDAARSMAVYDGRLRRAICGLKFHGRKAAAGVLGGLLAAMAPLEITRGVELVVPVPLHPAKLRARGFNQSDLLARPVASMLGVPCAARALRRVHQDHLQVELRAFARAGNVRNAFAPGDDTVTGTVLLVDDVFSTGSTAAACALALKDAGADRVVVLTLARALRRTGSATPTGSRR